MSVLQLGKLKKKKQEALKAVLPIILLVVLLSLTLVPIPAGFMLAFLFGSLMLMIGMMLFSLGADLAMETMGEKLGARLTKSRKLILIILFSFVLGFLITMSEPDLQVLANQIPTIPNLTLILAVSGGVGIFLMLAVLRMLFKIPLRILLLLSYAAVIALSFFAPKNFQAIAFDAGGVTTGPMTVPFIMAYGVGIAAIRSDKNAKDDSFGLIALSSVGPILAVLVISILLRPESISNTETWLPDVTKTTEIRYLFLTAFPTYLKELAIAILPITALFGIFQLVSLKLDRHTLIRIGVGLIYTYVGLVIFMTGVNVGFLPVGTFLGQALAGLPYRWIVLPIGMLVGYFIVNAEPAIYVLMHQVEDLTNGAIKGKTLKLSLSFSVSIAVGLALLRVLTGISIMWFMVPGYVIALLMMFFCPKIFTAIAFDSGGVASGPMTATFLLPFAMGACLAVGGNVTTDAFGVVAMVAMTPLLTIQALGIAYRIKEARKVKALRPESAALPEDPYAVIEL